jgi:hypothetical protein
MIQYFPIVTGSLTVLGNINVSGSITTSGSITISGSITSASFATSASNATNAISASYANNLTVAGTLTAQTIVVQTITSSVDYITGSSINGSKITDTHQFTGSILLSGSITQAGANATSSFTGLVSINTATPRYALDITGTNATGSLRVKNTGVHAQYTVDGTTGLFFRDGTNASWKSWQIATSYNDGSELSFMPSTNTSGVPTWDTTAMVIQGSGNVGIGTTSPSFILSFGGDTARTIGMNQSTLGTAPALTLKGADSTTGTNNEGGAVYISAGLGTGNGATSAIIFSNAGVLASGTTRQTLTERMRIFSSGNISIGTATDNSVKLYVAGTFTATTTLASGYAHTLQNQSLASGASGVFIDAYAGDSSSWALAVRTNNGNSYPFKIRCDGYLQSTTTYNNTTASPNYLSISTSGYFERYVASSARYKEEIKDWNENGLAIILALKPKTYKYKKEYYNKADVDFLGLIAEEVAEVNTYLADYENEDGTGQVENVRYATIVVPLIKALQELNTKFEDYKATHP